MAEAVRYYPQGLHGDLSSRCLPGAPVTSSCGLACNHGDVIATGHGGTPVTCQESCLERAECAVEEVTEMGTAEPKRAVVPRCVSETFADAGQAGCGTRCPCWRLQPDPSCSPATDGSPYSFQILRRERAPKGAVAVVRCQVSPYPWGSEELAYTGQCL